MSLPRQVLPGQFYLVTRRCAQRQFLLRPDAETNNAFTYCLIEAAQRCQIEVVLPCALSNHYHAVIFDRWGRYPTFLSTFTSCSLAGPSPSESHLCIAPLVLGRERIPLRTAGFHSIRGRWRRIRATDRAHALLRSGRGTLTVTRCASSNRAIRVHLGEACCFYVALEVF